MKRKFIELFQIVVAASAAAVQRSISPNKSKSFATGCDGNGCFPFKWLSNVSTELSAETLMMQRRQQPIDPERRIVLAFNIRANIEMKTFSNWSSRRWMGWDWFRGCENVNHKFICSTRCTKAHLSRITWIQWLASDSFLFVVLCRRRRLNDKLNIFAFVILGAAHCTRHTYSIQ